MDKFIMYSYLSLIFDVICLGTKHTYILRIQLAVLEHNHHINRESRRNKNGEVMYQRKYRKQSKRWDVTPILASKDYSYIPKLMDVISRERASSDVNLKHKQLEPLHHPNNIQKTIGHRPPENTSELVATKLSRFYHNSAYHIW